MKALDDLSKDSRYPSLMSLPKFHSCFRVGIQLYRVGVLIDRHNLTIVCMFVCARIRLCISILASCIGDYGFEH
jgi:hypothetical protein